ncbi:hypothetical protein P5673_017173 [Acropora cervicornis]|uniref:Integrase catalytic domain-containing protein n=1 Tax=Acropora cervicornis TaxID=6130 RepID=A0AAD9V3S8_ACRCE|nr:hypothetical protein P5673_017173 [Acropora cervicornis]
MSSTSSNAVTNKMKEIFSQWGVPEEIMSDNGPQFSSEQFHKFSQDFKHFSASPCYLQPNSEAESGACIAKKILTQPYTFLALMSYRATPHTHTANDGKRKSHPSTYIASNLTQVLPSQEATTTRKDEETKIIYCGHFDKRHGVQTLPDPPPGDPVPVKLELQKV